MKRVLLTLTVVVLLSSCKSSRFGKETAIGTGAGAVLGAVAGGVIGHQSGNRVEGAVIGGVAGAVAGGVIGNNMQTNKFCPSCGRVTATDEAFCRYDGTRLKIQQ